VPYLIRVRLPDQPGMLGRLATALGEAGADIERVAIVDRTEDEAVDDLVVSLPAPALADKVVTAVVSVPGAVLESIQPHPGRTRVLDELALLDEAASSRSPVEVVVAGLPDVMAVQYALAVDAAVEGGVRAASVSAPETPVLLGWLPLLTPRELVAAELFEDADAAGADTMLVAAPLGERSALVVGRNGGAAFRPAEVLRLAHLASLLRVATARR
jgi:hypothetical protein